MTNIKHISRQSGAVLAIALIFLVVLTLLGITGAQNTIIEERMTSNFRDTQIAIEAAEAAMINAGKMLDTTNLAALTWNGSNGLHDVSGSSSSSKDPFDLGVSTRTVTGITGIDGVASQNPVYYVERLPEIPLHGSSKEIGFEKKATMQYYRVTAKGWGKATTTDPQVVIQGTYLKL